MAAPIDLKINRDLINPNFEGYKLSLDKLPIYSTTITNGVYLTQLEDDQFSFHHAKLLGVCNHLTLDPWDPNSVYYVDSQWNVKQATAHDVSIKCETDVVQIPDSVTQQQVPGRVNVQLKFVSPDLVVICDGAGQLHIIDTGDRKLPHSEWKVLISACVPEETVPCLLVDAVKYMVSQGHKIECLLTHVQDSTPEEKDKYRSPFLTVLEWVTLTSADQKHWSVERTRQLITSRPFHYASLLREGNGIVVAGDAQVIFTRDSAVPVVSDEEKEMEVEERPPVYTWLQTQDDVSVQFTVPATVTKADIYFNLKTSFIEFGVKNGSELLKGPLHSAVDVESSTWTIEGQRIDLLLGKLEAGMWPTVVQGDTRGEMVPDATQIATIHERLAHLTSEELNPSPDQGEKPYNSQQLEECDMYPDDNFLLMRLDGDSHKITHKTNLGGHQWLFNTDLGPDACPAVCLRHDVDGFLWQPSETPSSKEPVWKHVATFNAFGYVQASKQQRLFTVSPPHSSYVAISDNIRHIYVYRQSTPVLTPVRNRKTGQQINTVAKQQVISLDSTDHILGLRATNNKIFILTDSKLFMVKIEN